MSDVKKTITSSVDVGGWAQHYATRPYGHYKHEVYQLFIDILAALRGHPRILDIGAGPGHLCREYFARHRQSLPQFCLLDSSESLLEIARARLKSRAEQVRTFLRNVNSDKWDKGVGKFDAIVSNNALFCVWPERLEPFYEICFSRLKKNGIMLNQQCFVYESTQSPYGSGPVAGFMRSLPEAILPKIPNQTAADKQRLLKEKQAAQKGHEQALAALKLSGTRLPQERGYTFLSAETHLRYMREAGFACAPIWRKREFAVILGVKGRPKVRKQAARGRIFDV